jgi:hypothetical protein
MEIKRITPKEMLCDVCHECNEVVATISQKSDNKIAGYICISCSEILDSMLESILKTKDKEKEHVDSRKRN